MANNGAFDPATSYARISERVENQGRDIVDLRSNMNTGFRNLESSIHALSTELRGNSRTQWPVIWSAIGVSFIVLAAVGGLAYQPVVSNQGKLEAALVRLADVAVTRSELNWRAERGAEDRARTDESIKTIRADLLPRAEWAERNLNRDHEVANLQRQLDVQRSDFQTFANSLGNGRDFILDLKTEVGRLRDQLGEIRARQYQRLGAPPG
jgi:hypothetical protein